MGLADFKARLLLFFARKLREWANSIDGSEPHPFTRVSGGPPQHWIDLVRERAPELLSLIRDYSPKEGPLPEEQVHRYRSDRDDAVDITDQKPVTVPTGKPATVRTGKEDIARKSEPAPLPPPKVVNKRGAGKLTRVKSWLPRSKPLTLKPLTEPNPRLQPPGQTRGQITEPAKTPRLIEVFDTDKQTVTFPERPSVEAENRKDEVTPSVPREPAWQPGHQAPRSDKSWANYETTETATPTVPAAQASGELNAARKSEVQRPVFHVIKKPQSVVRRHLQAILRVTKKTLRRAAGREVQSARPITAVNVLVNPSPQHSSSTPDVVRPPKSPKRAVRRSEMKAEPLMVGSARPTNLERRHSEPLAFPQTKALETATRQASPPTRQASAPTRRASAPTRQASPPTRFYPQVPIANVKTGLRAPTVEFQRPVNRFANASKARIQDAFVNMPALMDEEKMDRASSVHLADLRPGKNQWPDLPPAPSTEVADELAARERDIDRMRRLQQEQRGSPWNE